MEFKFRAGDLRPSPPPPPPRSVSPRPPEFHYLSKQGFPDASLNLNTNITTMRNSFDTNEAMHCEMELMRLREEKLLMEIERERFLKEEARKNLMLFEREMAIRGVAQSKGYSFRNQNQGVGPSSTMPSPSLTWGVSKSRLSTTQATSSSLSPTPGVVESTSYSFREQNQGGGLFSRSSFNAMPLPFSGAPSPFSEAPSPFTAAPSPFSGAPSPFNAAPSLFSATTPSTFNAAKPSTFSAAKPSTFSAAKPSTFSAAKPSTFSAAKPSTFSAAKPPTFSAAKPPTFSTATPSTFSTATPSTFNAIASSFSATPSLSSATPLPFRATPSLFSEKPSSSQFSATPSLFSAKPSPFIAKPSSFSATSSRVALFNTTPFNTTLLTSPATTLYPSPATTLLPSPGTTLCPSPGTTLCPTPATTLWPSPATTLTPSLATTSIMHSSNDWWKIEHLNPIGFGVVSLPPRVQPLIADVKKEPEVLHAVKSEPMETPDPEVFTENQKVKAPSVFTFDAKPFGVKKNRKDKRCCADLRADLRARNVSQAASKRLSSKMRKVLGKVTELADSVGAKEKELKVGETLRCVKTEGGFIQNPIVPNFLKFAAKEDKQPNELGIELPNENPNPYVVREKQKVETLSASTFGIKPFGGKKYPKEEWSCELCQLTVWTEMHFSEHLYSRRHKRKIAELRARINFSRAATKPIPNKRRKLLKVTEASGSAGAEEKESKYGETLQSEKTVPNFLKFAAKEVKQQNELVTEPLQEKSDPNVFREKQKAETPLASTIEIQPFGVKKNPKEWSCARCQITMQSERTFNAHLHGKKHKRNLIMRPREKPGPREKQKVKMPSASIIDIQRFCVKNKKAWKCALCEVETEAKKKAFIQHIRGKWHRCNEALLGARKESNVSQAATNPVPNERRNLLEVTEAFGSACIEKESKDGETVKCEKTEVIFIDLT